MIKKINSRPTILLIILVAFFVRIGYGLCINFAEVNTTYLQDYSQIYLIGLKYHITNIWPFWGPDITYTFSQIPGALQGLLVGLPFKILEIPEAPFIFLNIISLLALVFFAWYSTKRFPQIPKWFIYAWLLTAPWTMNFSTTVINPSYILAPAILFFIGIFEIYPFYKEKIISANLSIFLIGFALGWILQIHMSWVLLPFYIFISVYFLFKTKNIKIILNRILFLFIGFSLSAATLIPTLLKYGLVAGDADANIVLNLSNLKNVDVLTRFISFSTFEARIFISGGQHGQKALLLHNIWAVPFILFVFLTGIAQTIYYSICFFKKSSHAEFKYVKILTLGTILLVYITYLFAIRDVASYTFYVLLPISFWYSFYCLENLFKNKLWKKIAIIFLFSGLIYHMALAKEYFPSNSVYSKRSKIVDALKFKDSRIFAYRRIANWKKKERENIWISNIKIISNDTNYTYSNYFDNYPPEILPESLNKNYYFSKPYSCQVDSINQFSLGLSINLKNLNNKRDATISFYAKYFNINDCALVVSVEKPEKSFYWSDYKICTDSINIGNWKQYIINKQIPAIDDSLAKINIYLWLPSEKDKSKILIDNFDISFK